MWAIVWIASRISGLITTSGPPFGNKFRDEADVNAERRERERERERDREKQFTLALGTPVGLMKPSLACTRSQFHYKSTADVLRRIAFLEKTGGTVIQRDVGRFLGAFAKKCLISFLN